VPIPVFYCEGCQEALTDREILDEVVGLFAERTADAWYEREAGELLPPGTRCAKCGGERFRKETDILDVWFDSGASHLAVLGHEPDLPWPADLYLEAADQYRGWFHSSILVGVGLKGESPYRGCLTHGWVLNAQGTVMSKSLGNAIDPEEIMQSHGAEILRLWTSSADTREDTRLSEEMLERLSEAYRKMRNTFRYMLGNLYDFDPAKDCVAAEKLWEIDQWALGRAENLAADCRRWYQEFAFHKVHHALVSFATVDLSAVYFDVLKDRLYTAAPASAARRSAQTALYRLAHALTRLAAPLLSFTCEEVWALLPKRASDPDSVHLALFPEAGELTAELGEEQLRRIESWNRLMDVRPVVLKALEQARQEKFIRNALEARVVLSVNGDVGALLADFQNHLPMLFIVSEVELKTGAGPEIQVQVERARGVKCERCWKYATDVGASARWPTICGPCVQAVEEIVGGR